MQAEVRPHARAQHFRRPQGCRAFQRDDLGETKSSSAAQYRTDVASVLKPVEDDASGREDNRYVCEAVMTVRGTTLVSREATVNIYAAIDIVEAKLKSQLAKYKEKSALEPRRERMLSRWLGRKSGPVPEPDVPDAS